MKSEKLPGSFIFIILLMLLPFVGKTAYLEDVPVKVYQPDGAEIDCFVTGDEYYQWLHDINHYPVIRNPQGWYVYAKLQDGKVVATPYRLGKDIPESRELQRGPLITPEQWKSLRDEFWKRTPKRPVPLRKHLATDVAGTVNNLVVFIRFSDQTAFNGVISWYDSIFNSTVTGVNSMKSYFKEASYNAMTVSSTFYPTPSGSTILSYQDSNPRTYYMPWDSTNNPNGYKSHERTSREHTLLKNAVLAIASQVPAGLNIDFDNDGLVDNVCFIIRGGTTAWSTILWPHRWSLYSQTASINGKQVYDYNVQIQDHLSGSGPGVLAHEMFHTFGAPDLYHYTSNGITPVGIWDLMASNTNPPQHMGAFMKHKYAGWISSIPVITNSGTYTLNPLTSSTNNSYRLNTQVSASQYFIVEYRKKTGVFENSLPGSGLIIYRINTAAGNGNASGPPDEVYTYRPNGTLNSNGQVNNAYFNSAAGRTIFNDTTNPRCFLANDSLAHINIYNIGTAGNTISFSVNAPLIGNFYTTSIVSCPNQTVLFHDQSTGTITSRSWSFNPSTVTYVNGTNSGSVNPQVQFTAVGNYSVSLTVTGPSGSHTYTRSSYIHIQIPTSPPYYDDFESGSFATKLWTLNNIDNQTSWAFTSQPQGNPGSTKSLWVDFYNYDNIGANDELITPSLTLPSTGVTKLRFKVAYRPYNSEYQDSLKVVVFGNCGTSAGATVYAKTGTVLATGPASTNAFVPAVTMDWRMDTIDLSAYNGQTIVIKFIAVNGYGNNLYFDDVTLFGTAPAITAEFNGSPTSICQDGTVNFTDQSTGGPTSWFWSFGDGGTSTLQHPSHTYETPGPKTVSLTVFKSGSSNTMTKSNYITVNQNQPVSVSISQSPSGTVCQGVPVTFTATTVNGGSNPVYQWKRNGLSVGTNSPTYVTTTLANGDNITCILISNAQCATNNPATATEITVSVTSMVSAGISINALPPGPVCPGTLVNFVATFTGQGPSPAFQWKRNGQNVGTNSLFWSASDLEDGDSITCTMTSSLPCVYVNPVTSAPIVMTVNNPVYASITISASPNDTLCAGSPATFNAVPVHGGTQPVYQWKVNGINAGLNSSSFTYMPSDGDTVRCVLTSNQACVVNNPVASNPVRVAVLQYLPVSVSISVSPAATICQGSSVSFSATGINGGNGSYSWYRKLASMGNFVLVSQNQVYSPGSIGNGDKVYCKFTSALPCVTGNPAYSDTMTITVLIPQPVSVGIVSDPAGPVCGGDTVTFTASAVNGGIDPVYQWKKNNANFGGNSPVLTTSDFTDGDQFKCVVTSNAACVSGNPATSATIVMSVQQVPVISLGNDTTIPVNATLTLDPGSGYASYLWNNGATTPTLTAAVTGSYSVTVTTSAGCAATDSIHVTVGFFTVSGMFQYFNNSLSPMTESTVYLTIGNTVIRQTTSDMQGHYSFYDVSPGTYTLDGATTKAWGGVNSTDALLVLKHFVGLAQLSGLKFTAGNVDGSYIINTLDALIIQKRVVQQIFSFPVGDWVFEKHTVTVNGMAPVIQDIKALTSGDVNGSFSPQ